VTDPRIKEYEMSNDWIKITPAAEKALAVGELQDRRTWPRLTDKQLRKYAISLRDPNPLWHDREYAEREGAWGRRALPTAFCVIFNPMERIGLKPASDFWAEVHGKPGSYWGGLAAYNQFELERPFFLGDVITTEVRNLRCYEKRGKHALLVIAETEYRMLDEQDELVGVGVYGNIVQFDNPEGGA
jgi:acyl dehydratase